MKGTLHHDYAAIGHVTVDVLADGTRRPGGSALYSALQAARLGWRSAIVTAGSPRELEPLLAPYREELAVHVHGAEQTTTFETTGIGAERRQRLLAWAGPIPCERACQARIVHLAPVARELPAGWSRGGSDRARERERDARGGGAPVGRLLGLTPQGLVRRWPGARREVVLGGAQRGALGHAGRCDAMVLSEEEVACCTPLIERARGEGALVAITRGALPGTILLPGGGRIETPVTELADPVEDLGAGDVFAATLFVALAEGLPAAQAGALANAAAALRMRGSGPGAVGDRAAIEGLLAAGR